MHLSDLDSAYTVDKNGRPTRATTEGVHLHFDAQAGEVCDWCDQVQAR